MNFLKKIEEKGGKLYEVGGTLRDLLLGIPQKDRDLLVTHLSIEELLSVLKPFGTPQIVGKSFGVIKFRPFHEKIEYDIALPRIERSVGVKHRDFEVEYDPMIPVEKDLERRDFTMNAIARNISTGEIIDPFDGETDLKNRILRQVFENSFKEDPLRLLRAVQFSARFDLEIEPKTLEAMKENASLITTVSSERVIEEIRKLFMAEKPSKGFYLMRETDILRHVFPDVQNMTGVPQPKKKGGDVFDHTMKVLDASRASPDVEKAGDLEIMFAALFHDTGKPATYSYSKEKEQVTFYGHQTISKKIAAKWMKKYRASMLGIDTTNVETLVEEHMFETKSYYTDRAIRRFINKVGQELIFKLLDLRIADKKGGAYPENFKGVIKLKNKIMAELEKKPPFGPKDLALNGSDLMSLGFPQGREIGIILKDLVEVVLDEPEKNSKEELIKIVKEKFSISPS